MRALRNLSHDPDRCAKALRNAAPGSVVILDLETTGLGRREAIVSVGVLVSSQLFILFVNSFELSVVRHNITLDGLRRALEPLGSRKDLVCVFHNAIFDLGFLYRAGVRVHCRTHDTAKLLKLLDSDRKSEELGRFDRRYNQAANYRLKDVVSHLMDINAPHFPGQAAALDYRTHVKYLASDCLITGWLYRYLRLQLRKEDIDYYDHYVAPVTPMLVSMTEHGVCADPQFLLKETNRLAQLMRGLSDEHRSQFGQPLDCGDYGLRGWVYLENRGLRCHCPRREWVKVGKRRLPSLRVESLDRLSEEPKDWRQAESLPLVRDYLLARTLLIRLATLRDKHVDPHSGRIHSNLDDWQASGRVSSTRPNLQGLAGEVRPGARKEFRSELFKDTTVRSRNVLCTTEGYTLVAFDIAQADVRCLAHAVESLRESGPPLIRRLRQERLDRLGPSIARYEARFWDYFRPENRKPIQCPHCGASQDRGRPEQSTRETCPACGRPFTIKGRYPDFDAEAPNRLADGFRRGGQDFYTAVTTRMLGRPPKDKTERNHFKQTILGIVNGMSAQGLAERLDVHVEQAREYLARFAEAYPKEQAYIELAHHAAALTGYAETLGGRRRRVSPHWWMVNEPEVELLLSYRDRDKLWARVVPLSASRHTLTCWVLSVVDARYDSPRRGQEIYHHIDGRISSAAYRFFEDDTLVFRLPVRNISWRIIRRVRTTREECRYQGFDKTRRQLTNHIFQGSTADVARLMMIRSQPVCKRFGARLLLQIHDELVFETPTRSYRKFVRQMARVLQQPPTDDFRTPIVVEPKVGDRFGEMSELAAWEYAAWPIRVWRRLWAVIGRLCRRLTR